MPDTSRDGSTCGRPDRYVSTGSTAHASASYSVYLYCMIQYTRALPGFLSLARLCSRPVLRLSVNVTTCRRHAPRMDLGRYRSTRLELQCRHPPTAPGGCSMASTVSVSAVGCEWVEVHMHISSSRHAAPPSFSRSNFEVDPRRTVPVPVTVYTVIASRTLQCAPRPLRPSARTPGSASHARTSRTGRPRAHTAVCRNPFFHSSSTQSRCAVCSAKCAGQPRLNVELQPHVLTRDKCRERSV